LRHSRRYQTLVHEKKPPLPHPAPTQKIDPRIQDTHLVTRARNCRGYHPPPRAYQIRASHLALATATAFTARLTPTKPAPRNSRLPNHAPTKPAPRKPRAYQTSCLPIPRLPNPRYATRAYQTTRLPNPRRTSLTPTKPTPCKPRASQLTATRSQPPNPRLHTRR
jgi:hypothetical protein